MTRSVQEPEIVDLRDRPDLREAVIEQNFIQWGPFTGIDRNGMQRLFAADNARHTLPVTLVATLHGRYAGCVSLRERTMGMVTHPEEYLQESPWLSNMWVAEFARGAKLATRLTTALEEHARALGIRRIFSSTMEPDSLYHKLGYQDILTRDHAGQPMYLIHKVL